MAFISNIPIGSVAYASAGTNTADINGQLWITEIFVPYSYVVSIIGFLQGGTATTDNFLAALYDPGGNLIGNSATAGVILSGASTFAERTLLAPVQVNGPNRYYVAVQGNGTAAGAIQTIPASTFVGLFTKVLSGAFGTVPAQIVVPTTFAAGSGPIVYLK